MPEKEMSVPADAYRYLKRHLTDERCARMERVVSERTKAVRLVVQDIHDPHNISACMRSAEAFGVQCVDIVTLKQRFKTSTVARGVGGWLTVNRHDSVSSCVQQLRDEGYKIAAGVPWRDATPLPELVSDEKIAVVFGNEHEGISDDWLSQIDLPFTIPMVGMVESLNISVSAAVTMHHLTSQLRRRWPKERYFLPETEQNQLLSLWATSGMRNWPEQLRRARENTEIPEQA